MLFAKTPAFVDNHQCLVCHQGQAEAWKQSHHYHAMEEANADTVLANFDNIPFEDFGQKTRFYRQDEKFFIRTQGPEGNIEDYEVKYTFGFHPLQQYLIALPGGRLQAFSIAWDSEKKAWFHLYPNEAADFTSPLHWTKRAFTWNHACADCHMTNFQKGYDAESETYHSTWSELNVSCQSCHGPGEQHVAWAKGALANADNKGLLVNYQSMKAFEAVDTCAHCHSRRSQVDFSEKSSRQFWDNFILANLREDLYYPDGQVDEEVYVYGSFLQSKMYHAGVSCMNCHDPHRLTLTLPGNAVCTQCHQPNTPETFPQAAKGLYDTPAHHFHEAGSAGAQCVACHMPEKVYMQIDPRRDHSFTIPRPDLSLALGVPNACTQCHQEQSDKWALAQVQAWYGKKAYPVHRGEVIAMGRAGDVEAIAPLETLALSDTQPAIIRATAIDLLRQFGAQGMRASAKATEDKDPMVRFTAALALQTAPTVYRVQYLIPLLSDPMRTIRATAARGLVDIPESAFSGPEQYALFENALQAYREMQQANIDQPEGQMNLALLAAQQGHYAEAIEGLAHAINTDPSFMPSYYYLAHIYRLLGQLDKADAVLREAQEHAH